MTRAEQIRITWYDGLDNYMSVVHSEDTVLAGFFTVREWDFIQCIYLPVARESDLHLDDRGFLFHGDAVEIYTPEGETRIAKSDFFSLLRRLYAVLIEGANEDHHSVRYEPWWQAFIDAAYALDTKCDILSITEEEEIITDRLSNR
ncbi:hypothetical protein [Sulfurimonas sp. HSL3-7]|uniref:hypothetical protein n=1 Tax=Sulfonitrofixus jiaomeiensis TaxID=3131938 RepID=UPI0031F7A82B